MVAIGDVLRVARAAGDVAADVSLAALAAVVHRSPSRVHRAFVAVVGETPKAFTTRVRLDRAAAALLAGDRPVAVVAAEHGFASHAVFTRNFTRRFGVGPQRYRTRGLDVPGDRVAAGHGVAVAATAPCVGLYRMTSHGRDTSTVSYDIVVKDLPDVHALVRRKRVPREEIAAALGEILPAVFAHAQRTGVAMAGPPFSRYPEVGMGTVLMEGGVPTVAAAPGDADAGIEAITVPAGPAATLVHRGPYDGLPAAYRAIETWLQDSGRSAAGPPWETYLTDPGEHPDPATWETEVVQPLTAG